MNVLTVETTLKSPSFWRTALGSTCLITSIAILALSIHSIHFGHFPVHFAKYNTLAAMNVTKITCSVVGSGALAGLGFFVLKKVIQDKSHLSFGKARCFRNFLSGMLIVSGLVLITFGMVYLSSLHPQTYVGLHHTYVAYLANEQLLKAVLGYMSIGGFLLFWGMLETARHMSKNPPKIEE